MFAGEQGIERRRQLFEPVDDGFFENDVARAHPGRDDARHFIHAVHIVARQDALHGGALVQHVVQQAREEQLEAVRANLEKRAPVFLVNQA